MLHICISITLVHTDNSQDPINILIHPIKRHGREPRHEEIVEQIVPDADGLCDRSIETRQVDNTVPQILHDMKGSRVSQPDVTNAG